MTHVPTHELVILRDIIIERDFYGAWENRWFLLLLIKSLLVEINGNT
jgi:hypothetical protein